MEWISFGLAVIEQLGLRCFLCFLFERLLAGMVSICTPQQCFLYRIFVISPVEAESESFRLENTDW